MAVLEDEGYLVQPHISSGRIPTDMGYRHFVGEMMQDRELTRSEQASLQKELLQLRAKNVRMARTTAKLLSALSGNIGVSGVMDREEFYECGLRRLLEEENDKEELCRLAEALDYIDEQVDVLLERLEDGETKIYIGNENPIQGIAGYSMVVSPYENNEGEKGIVAVIGPKRMRYDRNKSLVDFVKKFLSSSRGTGLIVVISGSTILIG
jgi:transcriptional regulator of heat shock response